MSVGGRSEGGPEADTYLGTWWVPDSGREPVGGSLSFSPKRGASLVIVNREPTDFDDIADLVVRQDIGDAFAPFIAL